MDRYCLNLLEWYEKNKRDMPWRNTKDPYKIWLSEIILQQTRVAQGWNYYLKFIKNYPDVSALASASGHEILKLWQGLGYYSRARNMHQAALYIKRHYKGKFPKDYQSIRNLKGVGDYTAAAIASFAYNLPYPVIDGNVMRVYSRFLGIKSPVDSGEGRKRLQEAAVKLLPHDSPGTYNQAIMELGALCCTHRNPECAACPLQSGCYAYRHNLTAKLPVKAAKTKQRERYLNYIVIEAGAKLLLRNRTGKDIWMGLYDFPCIETSAPVTRQKIMITKEWKRLFKQNKPVIKEASGPYTHILSHQKLNANFIKVAIKKPIVKLPPGCFWIKHTDIKQYAVPRLIERYISTSFDK